MENCYTYFKNKYGEKMYKKSTSILSIVAKSFTIFLEKLPAFLGYIAYPILGQFAGIMVCFAPFLISPNPKNVSIPLVFICLIAGIALFCHAFWRFLLISGGLVLISRQIVENEPLREFSYYTEIFKKRSREYIVFILLASFLIPLLLGGLSGFFFLIFMAVFKNTNFNITLPPEIVSQISQLLIYKGLNIDITTFVNTLILTVLGLAFAFLIFILISSIFSVATESFVLNPNLTPTKSILKGAKLAVKNYFSNLGLLALVAIIGFIYGNILDLIILNPIFNPSLYIKYAAYNNIIITLKSSAAFAFGSILLPFGAICRTWWYLRMEKENTAKTIKSV